MHDCIHGRYHNKSQWESILQIRQSLEPRRKEKLSTAQKNLKETASTKFHNFIT